TMRLAPCSSKWVSSVIGFAHSLCLVLYNGFGVSREGVSDEQVRPAARTDQRLRGPHSPHARFRYLQGTADRGPKSNRETPGRGRCPNGTRTSRRSAIHRLFSGWKNLGHGGCG